MCQIFRIVNILAGMVGMRLDRPPARLMVWGVLIICSLLLNKFVKDSGLVAWYITGAWAFYYLGNTIILGTPLRSWLIKRFGETRAWDIYEVVLGVMFANIALSLSSLPLVYSQTLNLPTKTAVTISAGLFVVGFGSKVWSTWLTGLDVYYYNDLFLRKPNEKFITEGPYRWFKNPMYGIGNLHVYAAAVFFGSLEGLVWGMIYHGSIYGFYLLIEKPFVKRVYQLE